MAALLAADQLPAPAPLRKALHTIDVHLTETMTGLAYYPKQPENSRQLSKF
jgi:hypothetical protein